MLASCTKEILVYRFDRLQEQMTMASWQLSNWQLRIGGLIGAIGLSIAGATGAQAAVDRDPSPFVMEQFQSGFCDGTSLRQGIRDRLPEDFNDPAFNDPSLWLGRDIFAYQARFGKKIFEGWLVCPSSNGDRGRIDLVLNGQLWSVLDYFDRYELVQQFGISSDRADVKFRSGYNLRVFNRQGKSLGSYTCDAPVFGSVPSELEVSSGLKRSVSKDVEVEKSTNLPKLPSCTVKLDDANNGLGVRRSP
jgi:hypothetical protein